MNGQAQTTKTEWRQLLSLGGRLIAQPTLASQLDLILETAAELVGGDAHLWLSEALRRLPGAKEVSFPAEPASALMRRGAAIGRPIFSSEAERHTAQAVAMPLLSRDTLLGVLEVERPEGPPFSDDEIAQLEGLVTQWSIALQTAHQVAIERWRSQQLALVRTVSAQVADVLDLDELSRRVTDLVLSTFDYYHVALFTLEPSQGVLLCRASAGPRGCERGERDACPALSVQLGQGIIGHVAQSGDEIVAGDVSRESRYRHVEALPETRSEAALPLRIEDRVLGVLDVQSDRRDAFSDEDRFVFEALADSVAIAIRNANLYRSERWRRQVAESMQDVAGLLSAGIDLEEVLDAILTALERNLPSDVAAIWLLRDEGLCLCAVHGHPAQVCLSDTFSDDGPWLHQALDADRPIVRSPESPPEPLGDAMAFPPDYSAIAAPLRAGDQPLGVLTRWIPRATAVRRAISPSSTPSTSAMRRCS